MSTPLTVRLARLAAGALALTFVGTACVPDVPPAPTTTTTSTTSTTTSTTSTTVPECVPVGDTETNGAATVTVSQVNCLEVGDEVTVTGSGFTTTGNLGTRFPFPGQPAGVYVVIGEFADTWQPSTGAPGSSRKILAQQWPIPEPTFTASGGELPYVLLQSDGSFTVTMTVVEQSAVPANPNFGFAIYPGSGAINASEELWVGISLDG